VPLDRTIWTSLIKGSFSVDCPSLKLVPKRVGEPSYSGSGSITQDSSGFAIKLFTKRNTSPNKLFALGKWKAGELIGEEAYYKLEAVDLHGRCWRAGGIIPDKQSGFGAVIGANVPLLRLRETVARSTTNYIRIVFPTEIRFPTNTVVKKEKQIGGKARELSTGLTVSRFLAAGMEFEIERELGVTELRIRLAQTPPTDKLVDDIIDSFNFVTANSVQWSIVEKVTGAKWETLIRGGGREGRSRIGPPLEHASPSSQAVKLLNLVLLACRSSRKRGPGSMQALFQAVISAGTGNAEVEALTLSTAVESLLANYFQDLGRKMPSLSKDIAAATKLISEAKGLSPKFKARLKGSLGGMANPRAKDYLIVLRDRGLVDAGLVKQYSDLRNKSAHGVSVNPADFQAFLSKCGAALTLFYVLIFLRVGYTGPYFDYSKLGYPETKLGASL
jgi:hypothetical protein